MPAEHPSPVIRPATLLDPARLLATDTIRVTTPFAFLIARRQLPESAREELARDFPRWRSAGYFPHRARECGPSINRLVEEISSPAFADALGERLGFPGLGSYPLLVTLCRSLNHRHGTIHTDSRSKIVTALLYLNDNWPVTSAGCLRFLGRADDIDALLAPEIQPIYGTLAAFRRTDNSFHGHLPWAGERRVIQAAWLTSEEEKRRKTHRATLSRLVKCISGGLDGHFGARRGRNAAHID